MKTLFISDLHLCEERPRISALFVRFLDEIGRDAQALYILGDLFDYWVGDDQLDHDSLAREVASALARTADRGTSIFFMHGNRDFLIGGRFAREARLTLLEDPALVRVDNRPLLLMHGDTLCTDDLAYQQFRLQVRDPQWQAQVLAKTFAERTQLARTIRSRSDVEKAMKAEAIMDVNADAVTAAFERYRYPVMIHGHTHRPARHESKLNGHACTRWVLADWHTDGSYLCSDGRDNGLTAHSISGA
ncbi:MAG: UDP-2,3-diacylglucosamine diphosphatase [Betaproteobacteria bacterium]